jgi:hypothetical protein
LDSVWPSSNWKRTEWLRTKHQGKASRREEERWFTFLRASAASGDSSAAGAPGSADGAARSSTGGATFKLKATLILEGNTLYVFTIESEGTYLYIATSASAFNEITCLPSFQFHLITVALFAFLEFNFPSAVLRFP